MQHVSRTGFSLYLLDVNYRRSPPWLGGGGREVGGRGSRAQSQRRQGSGKALHTHPAINYE